MLESVFGQVFLKMRSWNWEAGYSSPYAFKVFFGNKLEFGAGCLRLFIDKSLWASLFWKRRAGIEFGAVCSSPVDGKFLVNFLVSC